MAKIAIVVVAHSYDKSYSYAIKDAAVQGFKNKGKEVKVIDLSKDAFNPVGIETNDKKTIALVKKYKALLKTADEVVITYPVWWSCYPANLAGFVNHVMISEDMVKKVNGNFKPARNDLHKLSIFTTCFTPNFINRFMIGNANVKHSKGLHKVTGFHKFVYKNIDQVSNSQERRERFLNKVTKIVGSK